MLWIVESMDDSGLQWLDSHYPHYRYNPAGWTRLTSLEGMGGTEHGPAVTGLIVRNQAVVGASLLERLPGLRVVGRLGSGTDNLDVQALEKRGIRLVTAAGLNRQAVAQAVCMMVLWWSRPWAGWWEQCRGGAWPRNLVGHEVSGWTMGVVGMGHVGSLVAHCLSSWGARVLAYDPHRKRWPPTVTAVNSLEALLAAADVVTLHCSLSAQTRGMLDGPRLALLGEHAYLINTARGGLISEPDLAAELEQGRLAGVWLDVRDPEPPQWPDGLAGYDRVWLTPHIAGLTREAQAAISSHVVQEVVRYLNI